ncbi:hypothetical protein MAC_02452 [Metarhizium acridum CQMa 102]|uniref:Uncharacterized protein n=1 Tax=Metarhizium acridum (strain CQMa 102) TaxID=655827 RepID=E9DXV4_METAQ|nr:uncharacterized protein MAC_02452 [Metarhizium acridum CQMa 102]EFY91567.1 hypothetical protein MAC_02452 [Metarhizium acridum CQMa 102]
MGVLIRRPPHDVFEALADPSTTTRFWYTKSSGRMSRGATLTWAWEMHGVSTAVQVEAGGGAPRWRGRGWEWQVGAAAVVDFVLASVRPVMLSNLCALRCAVRKTRLMVHLGEASGASSPTASMASLAWTVIESSLWRLRLWRAETDGVFCGFGSWEGWCISPSVVMFSRP